ncbi:hypothetical protein B0H16DRAFT_1777649 [Mycena metata]|uniref:F-box domain-containing protein n=1 Tax=Mycena metata TaxID=1033252 RepID=A0AAD7HUA2_9AGAR|nr:hypothetical protein B0H16DRAFT_1777649 [Mycena metata]
MHRCLKILEIVDAVCVHLNSPDPLLLSSRHLSAVARTCTTFSGPALDHLWSVAPLEQLLIYCMPSDLWALERFNDFETIYSCGPGYVYKTWLPSEALSGLSVSLPKGLFQNPQTLTWKHEEAEFHHIKLFLRPTLTDISIGLPSLSAVSLLSTLAAECPKIATVYIDSSASHYTPHISDFIQEVQSPERVSVYSLTQDVLEHLSRLPTLLSLGLQTLPPTLQASPAQETNGFTSLSTLLLGHPGIRPTTELLGLCSAAPLTKFRASFVGFVTATEMHELFVAMAAGFSHPTLQHLCLDTGNGEQESDPATLPIPHHFLRPLLSFNNLALLSVVAPVGFDLDNDAVSDVARALPHIVTFKLLARFLTETPRTTLGCLHSFAQYCPQLESLSIALDATNAPTVDLDRRSQSDILHQGLRVLNVANSPISNAISVARFLSLVFPKIRSLVTQREYSNNDEDDEEVMLEHAVAIAHHKCWKEVDALLPHVLGIREEGRALERAESAA